MTKRKSNLELLRIVAMLMIIAHHYVLYGIMQNYDANLKNIVYESGSSLNKIIAQILYPGGMIGVNCFFIITGFFGIESDKIRISKILKKTVFYSVFGFLIYGVLLLSGILNNNFGIREMIKCITPVCSSAYWFISVYVILTLMKSALNGLADKINGMGSKKTALICLLGLAYYIFVSFGEGMYRWLVRGALLYIIGALIKYNKNKLLRIHSLLWLIAAVVSWTVCIIYFNMDYFGLTKIVKLICKVGTNQYAWESFSAISLFMFFNSIKEFENKKVNTLAKSSFAVYLSHEHPLFREILYSKVFHVDSFQWKSSMFLIYAVLTVVCIYITFGTFDIVIDMIVNKLRKSNKE